MSNPSLWHNAVPNLDMNDVFGYIAVTREAVNRALRDDRLSKAACNVLSAILDRIDPATKVAIMTYPEIEEATGLNRFAIERAMTELRTNEYIITYRQAPPSGGRAVTHFKLDAVLKGIEPATLWRAEIDKFIARLRGKSEKENATISTGFSPDTSKVAGSASHPADFAGSGKSHPADFAGSGKSHPADFAGSASHPAKSAGSEKAHPADFAGSAKPAKSMAKAPHPADFAGSAPSHPADFAGSEVPTTSLSNLEKKKNGKEGRDGRTVGATMFNAGVVIPLAVQAAIDAGTARGSALTLIETIDAALAKGIDASVIEADLRKAYVWEADQTKGREPSPSAILKRCTTFVERSENQKPSFGSKAGKASTSFGSDGIPPVGSGFIPAPPDDDF